MADGCNEVKNSRTRLGVDKVKPKGWFWGLGIDNDVPVEVAYRILLSAPGPFGFNWVLELIGT